MVTVRSVPAATTRPLRRQVLRPHQTLAELADEDAADPEATHIAAFDATGQVVGTGIVSRRGSSWQVRGMAVAPDQRGRGVGSMILRALLAHADAHGGGPAWCNARVPARALYEHQGFHATGQPFDLPHIGPHIRMTRPSP